MNKQGYINWKLRRNLLTLGIASITFVLVLALFISQLSLTGFVIQSGSAIEKTIEIEIWADALIEIETDKDIIRASIVLDNGTILSKQEIEFYLDDSLIEINQKEILNLSNTSPGTYSLRTVSQGSYSSYINQIEVEKQIEIKNNRKITIIEDKNGVSKTNEEPQINVTLQEEVLEEEQIIEIINKTEKLNIILEGYNCQNFTENILWSSDYNNQPQGSTKYHTWQINHTCEEINQSTCILNNVEIKTRFIYISPEETLNTGQGYVQISNPDPSICNTPEQGTYLNYLAFETLKEDEIKLNNYCGRNKNPGSKCALESVENYKSEVLCYGIKTYASQSSIVDVFEIKYDLCWEA